jgi:DinB family protein
LNVVLLKGDYQMEALEYLAETRDGVLGAVEGLSEAQWRFKPTPDQWCPLEIVEHLGIVGDRIVQILKQLGQDPADRNPESTDAFILKDVLDRSRKFQAPPIICPTRLPNPAEALEQFLSHHASVTERLAMGPALRQILASHPVYGPLDGYQWILLHAAHNARHTQQIREVLCATCS